MAVSVTIEGALALVTIDNPPVNAASHAVRQGLVEAVAQVEAEDVRAAVLLCAGRTFVAGADVREFDRPPQPPHLPDVILTLEAATKPWVAALHGTALGGGLEIALGCAYRIATPNARMGLPEVHLGLIPGAGGTVRLPRLIGAEAALDIMASGKPIGAAKALDLGLIDALAKHDLRADALAFAARIAETPPPPLTARDIPSPDRAALDAQIARIRKRARGQTSPVAVTEALENTLALPADEALDAERALFLRLKADPQSAALRHIFFSERAAAKIDAIADEPRPDLAHIGIVGGGTMGAGIAAACLLSDLQITMIERDGAALEAGRARIADILSGAAKRGLIDETRHETLRAALHGGTDYAALAETDLVIEAVFEDMDTKRRVFAALDGATRPDAILATNTSYLDVGEIAQAVADPARVIGLHFFSPAHIMKLLELVIPDAAGPRAIAAGAALGKRLGKITVPAGVCDGFIGNRIMAAYRRACDEMIEDGALPAQVDAAMRDYGFPMGVFEMQDLAGLDIAWAMRKRRAATRDPAERYVDIPDRLCEAGRLGRKAGRGWYAYADGKPQVDAQVTALIEASSARQGIVRRPFTDGEIMETILTTMQTEGARILDEGIAARASDIDVVMVNGYAFPRWRGGPMFLRDA